MRRAALSLLVLAACAAKAEEPGVTPYRPSVSSPAGLSAAGQLELELGGLAQRTEGSTRSSLPFLFKLAFNEDWAVLLGGEALVQQQGERGAGDLNLILKRAISIDKDTAVGFELGAKLPSAREPLGSGRADYSINTILSRELGPVHMDANLNATRLGAADAGTGRTQTGMSASFSTPLNEQWGVTGELAGTRRSGATSTAQALVALAYAPSKRMTIDVGFAHGLNKASTQWSLFSGLVVPLQRF